jgi:hypothetical protein
MNDQEDWDCDFYYLIVDGNEIKFVNRNSIYWREKVKEAYPDRIEHGELSRHRGYLESTVVTEKLKEEYPKVYERLNQWCEFMDFRK